MGKTNNYILKFNSFKNKTLFEKLENKQQDFIKGVAFKLRFTFQEFRQVVQAARDLSMWGECELKSWWDKNVMVSDFSSPTDKKRVLIQLQTYLDQLKAQEKKYTTTGYFQPTYRKTNKIISKRTDKTINGMCPVASEKTVCCNLHTIDAVENCIYGCSYCTIQTFYGNDILIHENIKEKLEAIPIDPDRFYHFGTGQSSDSLAWGNRNHILDAHCYFASRFPNILMEFKTKSKNIKYFMESEIPENIVCSWSLNTPERWQTRVLK